MISKELLSEVFGFNISYISNDILRTVFFHQQCEQGLYEHEINIYELAHKCKEWAWSQKAIITLLTRNENGFKCILEHRFNMDFDGELFLYNENNNCVEISASEAVFKACQWILDNKEQHA